MTTLKAPSVATAVDDAASMSAKHPKFLKEFEDMLQFEQQTLDVSRDAAG